MSPSRLEVGRVDKPHGLTGEVIVALTTNRRERVDPGAELVGGGRTLEIVSSRPHQHRFIVRFAGIIDRDGAEALRGVVLEADALDEPDVWWVHDLVGALVLDLDGEPVGRVEAVEANPASDLLVLDTAALVPLRFVVERSVDGVIVIDPPPGLLDL